MGAFGGGGTANTTWHCRVDYWRLAKSLIAPGGPMGGWPAKIERKAEHGFRGGKRSNCKHLGSFGACRCRSPRKGDRRSPLASISFAQRLALGGTRAGVVRWIGVYS